MNDHHTHVARSAPAGGEGLPRPALAIGPYAVILATAALFGASHVITQRWAVALAAASVLAAAGAALRAWMQRMQLCERADRFIAAGAGAPPTAAVLAARRAELLSTRERRTLATSLRRLVGDAQAPPTMSARIPTDRRAVRAEAAHIERLAARLADVDTPVAPRSVAGVHLLITDPGSPIFRSGRPGGDDLHRCLKQILFELERGVTDE
jgi:hypothetical protein